VNYSATANLLQGNINGALAQIFGASTTTGTFGAASQTVTSVSVDGSTIPVGTQVTGLGIPANTTVTLGIKAFTSSTLTNTSGTDTVSGFSAGDIAKIFPGMAMTSGSGIPAGTTVLAVNPGTPNTIQLSAVTTAAVTSIPFLDSARISNATTTAGSATFGISPNATASAPAAITGGFTVDITFAGVLAASPMGFITASGASLTGGTTPSATVAPISPVTANTVPVSGSLFTTGSGNEVQRLTFPTTVTTSPPLFALTFPLVGGSTSTVSVNNTTQVGIAYSSSPTQLAKNIQSAIDTAIGAGRVVALANSATEVDLFYGGNLRGNVPQLTVATQLSPAIGVSTRV
jgi:hypothetical protein